MRIRHVDCISAPELVTRIRQTRLRGHGQPLVYEHARLELKSMSTDDLWPAQRYLLTQNVERIHDLRAALLERGIDIFALDGACLVQADGLTDDGRPMPVLPPIIEESVEPDGRTVLLINDGMHRVWAARQRNLPITVVLVRDVPRQWPYYAFPLENGWADVREMTTAPPTHEKKNHRDPGNHKALFRDFNAVFPGVQETRNAAAPPPQKKAANG
ncbi:MAG TPA: hypothetical protein VFV47_04440 [Hyphomicrobiaceae bacterium]|nr:hypothetical protein [Hyphomicrobiaceae bacterium]